MSKRILLIVFSLFFLTCFFLGSADRASAKDVEKSDGAKAAGAAATDDMLKTEKPLTISESEEAAVAAFESFRKNKLEENKIEPANEKSKQFFRAMAPFRLLESIPMHLIKTEKGEDAVTLYYAPDDAGKKVSMSVQVSKEPLGWEVGTVNWEGEEGSELTSQAYANFFREFQAESIWLCIAGLLCLPVGLVSGVAFVWQLVIAFRQNIWWGLGSLFVPFVSIVYMILHWQRCKWPIVLYLVNVFLLFAAATIFVGVMMSSQEIFSEGKSKTSQFRRITQ